MPFFYPNELNDPDCLKHPAPKADTLNLELFLEEVDPWNQIIASYLYLNSSVEVPHYTDWFFESQGYCSKTITT